MVGELLFVTHAGPSFAERREEWMPPTHYHNSSRRRCNHLDDAIVPTPPLSVSRYLCNTSFHQKASLSFPCFVSFHGPASDGDNENKGKRNTATAFT